MFISTENIQDDEGHCKHLSSFPFPSFTGCLTEGSSTALFLWLQKYLFLSEIALQSKIMRISPPLGASQWTNITQMHLSARSWINQVFVVWETRVSIAILRPVEIVCWDRCRDTPSLAQLLSLVGNGYQQKRNQKWSQQYNRLLWGRSAWSHLFFQVATLSRW